jgi:hypothetical protein
MIFALMVLLKVVHFNIGGCCVMNV